MAFSKHEIRDIFIQGYITLRSIVQGKFKEAKVSFKGTLYKIQEGTLDIFGKKKVMCNYCGWEGKSFHTMVSHEWLRRNAMCPNCDSLERHRAFLEYFKAIRPLLPAKISLLQVAPDYSFYQYCKKDPSIDYMTIDIAKRLAMKIMDVQDLKFENESFDVVVCFHVLDFVEDHDKALREFFRVLKKDGVAIIQEQLGAGEITIEYEKPSPSQDYRIRAHGKDFNQKMRAAGFLIDALVDHNLSPTNFALKNPALVGEYVKKLSAFNKVDTR